MNESAEFWQRMIPLAANDEQRAMVEERYREALSYEYGRKHARKHAPQPGGLRARRKDRRERDRAGYCRHGVYVGGCGVDWMCGRCENGEHWDTSHFSKSERVQLDRAREVSK